MGFGVVRGEVGWVASFGSGGAACGCRCEERCERTDERMVLDVGWMVLKL